MIQKIIFSLFLTFFSVFGMMSQSTVSGVVKDNDGLPMPGATVIVANTTRGTVTDFDGKYEIAVSLEDKALEFSYVGFTLQKVQIGNKTTINVSLEPSENSLDEVVVVGYGTQKKSDITGAVASLDAKVLEERPQVNIQQAIQGALPGVNISVNSNTASGASNSINIRGRRSISGGSDPLIVLDGVIFSGSLSEININDISNIEVLKDASSTAIYGSRGANGVILLTTKKGTVGGKPQLNFTTYYGRDIIYDLPDLMDADTFFKRKVERYGIDSDLITDTEREVYANGEAVDYVDLALRDGTRAEHNLSISGGTESMQYFMSGNFQDVKGVAINDDFQKVNFRVNLQAALTDWLTIGTNTLVGFSDKSGTSSSFTEAFYMNPLTRPFDADGNIAMKPWPEDGGFDNPLENLLYENKDKTTSLVTNNFVDINFPFIEGLSYRLNTGYTLRNTKEQNYRGRNSLSGSEAKGYADEDLDEQRNWLIENVLTYKRDFGKHNVFLTALYSAQERIDEGIYVQGKDFPNDIRSFYQFSDAQTLISRSDYARRNNIGQMLRLNYNYDSKYLLTATVRRDGYSAFGNDTKYGTFPSLAVGWNISEENFLKNNSVLNKLKLRLSYGESGNQAISPYRTLAGLVKQDYIDGNGNNLIGYRPGGLGNDKLGWETTTSYNFGVDFGLFKNRIDGSINVYKSKTTDLLLSKSIPGINGSTSIIQNVGETKGNGFELALNTRNVVSDNFTWSSQVSFTRSRNEIVNVGLRDEAGKFIDDIGSGWFIGQPIDVNYSYVIDGVWQTDEATDEVLSDYAVKQAGDVKYRDVNGDQIIDEKDRTIIGSLEPDFTLGFNNTITYKNFSLDFFFYWLEGVSKRNVLITTNDFNLRRKVYNVNYWSPENPTNDFPENADRTTNPLSAGWYEDASFLRLQNVTFSYRFPQDVTEKLNINKLELFLNGKNLFTNTDWRGIDPESSDQTDRPFSRTYLFGVRLGL